MTVSILIVDDHPLIRQGLRNLLNGVPDFQVVGEAGDGLEAMELINKLKPQVMVVDLMMPNLNGLEVLRRIKKLSPATLSIVLSMQSSEPYVIESFKAGAAGYIIKDTAPVEVVAAIQAVLLGDRYISPSLSTKFEEIGLDIDLAPANLYQTLTARERQILQMTAEGSSSREIGGKLKISPRTVEIHRSRVMKKLGLHNQKELIKYAIKQGILQMND